MIISIPGSSPYGFRLASGDGKVVTVARVRKESKAQQAGLREGDVILAINGISCAGLSYNSVFNLTELNDQEINLTITRSGTGESFWKNRSEHNLFDEPSKYRISYISKEPFALNKFQRQPPNSNEFINQQLPKIYIAANEDNAGNHFFSRSFVSLEKKHLHPDIGFEPKKDSNETNSENVIEDTRSNLMTAKNPNTKSGNEKYNDLTTTFALTHKVDCNQSIQITPYAEQNVYSISKTFDNIPEKFQIKSLAIMQQNHPTWTNIARNELISKDKIYQFYQPQNKLISGAPVQKQYDTLQNPSAPKIVPSNILQKYDIGNLNGELFPHETSLSNIGTTSTGVLKTKHDHPEQINDAFKLSDLYTNHRSEHFPVQATQQTETKLYKELAPPPPPPLPNLLNGIVATRYSPFEMNLSRDEYKANLNVKDSMKGNLEDKVKKAKDIAQSVLSPANKNSRGQKMFLKRRANSENWIVKDIQIENSFSTPHLNCELKPRFNLANRELTFWKPPSQPFSQAKPFSELTLGYCDL